MWIAKKLYLANTIRNESDLSPIFDKFYHRYRDPCASNFYRQQRCLKNFRETVPRERGQKRAAVPPAGQAEAIEVSKQTSEDVVSDSILSWPRVHKGRSWLCQYLPRTKMTYRCCRNAPLNITAPDFLGVARQGAL